MGTAAPLRLILASGSPARRELLTRAGYTFTVQPAHVEEPTGAGFADPRTYVHTVAWLKAAAVASQVPEGVVLAADTVGWLDDQVIGKPADEADARRILSALGGREHELWTGIALWRRPDDLQICWQEKSRVFFTKLTPAEMDRYLAGRQWQGCSGAYAIQEKDDPYVHLLEGSMSNVIGLPMESLERVLEDALQLRALAIPEIPIESPSPALSLVVLQSSDVQASKDFYSLMGLSFVEEQHGTGPRHYSTTLGALILEIYPCQGSNPSAPLRIGFRVPSLDRTLEVLRSRGARIVREAKESPWGRRAVVEDPDGNRVELT